MSNSIAPLVSVLMPIYNHARFLEQGLESVLAEGWPNLELVAIDDGSSDASFAILQDWLKQHGHRFAHVDISTQPNAGITCTLNRLVARSTGEYIVLLASDDQLLPGGIEARLNHLRAHPECLAVIGDCIGIDDDGNRIHESVIREKFKGDIPSLRDPARLAVELILNWSVPGPVLLAHRGMYHEIGCYNENYFIEDRDYYLRLLARDALTFLDHPVAAYRVHAASISGNLSKQIRIGSEIVRIEKHLLPSFSGLRRLALQLHIWSNGSAYHTAPAALKLPVGTRCLMARIAAGVILRSVRSTNFISVREEEIPSRVAPCETGSETLKNAPEQESQALKRTTHASTVIAVFIHYGNHAAARRFAQMIRASWPSTKVIAVDTASVDSADANRAFEFSGYGHGIELAVQTAKPDEMLRVIVCNDTIFSAHDRRYVRATMSALHKTIMPERAITGCAEVVPPSAPTSCEWYFPTFLFAIQGTPADLLALKMHEGDFENPQAWEAKWRLLPQAYRMAVDHWLQPTSFLKGWYQAIPGRPLPPSTLLRKRFAIFQEHTLPGRARDSGFAILDLCASYPRLKFGRLKDRGMGNLRKWSFRLSSVLKTNTQR